MQLASSMDGVWLCLCGVVAGVVSMWLYKVLSPQDRIDEVVLAIRDVQHKMHAYEGEFEGMWQLSKQNMLLSLKRVGYALGPSLLAGVPVVLVLLLLERTPLSQRVYFGLQPEWLGSWLTLFFGAVTVAALAVKVILRVK